MLDFERLLKDAENGVLPALYFLGDIYLDGLEEENIEPNLEKAVQYYDKAADGGMEDAMLQLGFIYCAGKYREPDYIKGLAYYERAAALGNTTALGNLGMSYCNGYGVEKDEKKGFEYFMKAAEGGNSLAMNQIADMYRDGTGVEKNEEKVTYWRNRAEEQKRLDEEAAAEQETSESHSLEAAFNENLKFISQTTMDADFVKDIFEENHDIRQFTLGQCEFKTGHVITADPLCYLQDPKNITLKEKFIAPGTYPVQVSVMNSSVAGLRIIGARLRISEKEAVKYELASGLAEKDGEYRTTYAGFPVECGMACFCDEQAAQSYWRFLSDWYNEHKDGNIYDDYFAELFAESYRKEPAYQREGGDLLLWHNPIDNSQIAMFASGLGDGYYTDYWGIDSDGKLCDLVIIFMNPGLFR